jgi:hypothetical protein
MTSLYEPRDKSGRKAFHCEKHRLTMFSLNYCPICVAEQQKEREVREGSTMRKKKPKVIILDDNPVSIACYLEEYGDKIFKKRRRNHEG